MKFTPSKDVFMLINEYKKKSVSWSTKEVKKEKLWFDHKKEVLNEFFFFDTFTPNYYVHDPLPLAPFSELINQIEWYNHINKYLISKHAAPKKINKS